MTKGSFERRQALIDEMLSNVKLSKLSVSQQEILASARRGQIDPTNLAEDEIRNICYALVIALRLGGPE